jgi:hypothetical protein
MNEESIVFIVHYDLLLARADLSSNEEKFGAVSPR